MATQKQWSDLLPPSRAKTWGSQGQGNAKWCEMWRTCHEAMKPWGHQAIWSSPPLKALDRSASLRDSWFGCQACPLTSTRFTWTAATHIRGMDLAIMFGSPWASESGLKASQQCCTQPRPHLGFIYPPGRKRRATEPSPQHLNIQTLQALSLDVLRLSSLPKKAPKTSNLLSLKPCEVTSTDVIA